MALTFNREVLTDSKPAMRVEGSPAGTVWVRVRLLKKFRVAEDNREHDLVLVAQAYGVDAVGVELDDAPSISVRINGPMLADGTLTLPDQIGKLKQQCLKSYVPYKEATAAMNGAPAELVE